MGQKRETFVDQTLHQKKRNPTFFNFNLNEKKQWLFPSEDSQSSPPPRPPRRPAWSPEPPCGTAQTALSGSDHTPTTPAHPTSRVSTLVTTAGTPPDSLPTQRPSPPTERLSSSTPGGECSVPSSSPTAASTTSETLPWSTPRASSLSWLARSSSWDSPRPTESTEAQPERDSTSSTLVRASTHSDSPTTLTPSPSSRSRRSRTEDLPCSPCSDSTSRPSSLERDQCRTGRSTLPTHGPSTDSPRSSPPSSPLTKLK